MTFLPLIALLAASPAPPAEGELPRSGYYGAGFNLEPLSIGPLQAISGGGVAIGVSFQAAIQIDLGTRWALRLPLDLGIGGLEDSSFVEFGFTPGVLYRWRDDADQRWVPYFGGGIKLGVVGAGRELLGQPLVSSLAFDIDFDDGDSSSNPNVEFNVGAFPELWAGVEWHPTRWFSLNLGGAYTYMRVLDTGVHVLHQRVGMRFSL